MFEKYLIVPGSLRNESWGDTRGFCIDVRLCYYRGLGLSMVEGFEIMVDAKSYEQSSNLFRLKGEVFTHAEMADEADLRWEFDELATVFVPREEDLAPGSHDLDVTEIIRISYMPQPARRQARATMQLSGTHR